MSLLKLLSAAKSLDGSKPMPSPYKMNSSRFLPKFGSSKNPFARAKTDAAKPASGRMETDSLFGDEEPKVAPAAPAPKPVAKAPAVKEVQEVKPVVEPEKKSEAKPASVAPAPVPAAAAPTVKEPKTAALAEFIKKLNPLKYLPKRRPETRSARPKVARAAQGELSLEKVRVLRNELNDSDLEFVTTPKLVSIGTGGTALPASQRSRISTWGRLTSRVIGAVETQTQ